MHIYVLIMAQMGEMGRVAAAARRLNGVSRVTVMLGEYDVMLTVHAPDLAQLQEVMANIQQLPGVDRALTCTAPDVDHIIGPIARERVLQGTSAGQVL